MGLLYLFYYTLLVAVFDGYYVLLDVLTIPADDKHGSIVIIEIEYAKFWP
jgi:hypothetical protein